MEIDSKDHLTLAALTAALLDKGEIDAEMQNHLTLCQECASLVPRAELLARELTIARLSVPSAHALAAYRALDPNQAGKNPLASIKQGLGTIRLFLQSDSRREQAALGLRGSGTPGYRLLYSADEMDVDLFLAPQVGTWSVDGEVMDLEGDEDAYLVQLVPAESRPDILSGAGEDVPSEYMTQSDEEGRFRFDAVSSGEYDLILTPAEGPLFQISSLELS